MCCMALAMSCGSEDGGAEGLAEFGGTLFGSSSPFSIPKSCPLPPLAGVRCEWRTVPGGQRGSFGGWPITIHRASRIAQAQSLTEKMQRSLQ